MVSAGFTVIESLVAISILLLAVSGSFAAAQSSLQSSNFVKNRVTAYYLAQEGIEYIRHLRDNNGLAIRRESSNPPIVTSWLENIISGSTPPCAIACKIDATLEAPPTVCGTGVCPNLNLNTTTGQFQYSPPNSTNIDSGFKRTIKVVSIDLAKEVKVTSTVTWTQAGIQKTLNVSENLYNWQQL